MRQGSGNISSPKVSVGHGYGPFLNCLTAKSTRRPSWRKGKRATAVRVRCMKALTKKSTANQRYAISCWWLILTVDPLLTVCDIFGCRGWKSPFSPTVLWLQTPSGGTPSNINVIYASLKSTCGLQFCRWQFRSIFIRFAVVASQICEITRNSEKIWIYSSSRSSKVIDLGANRKRICNFLLVVNSNFGRISYRFRDVDA